jgi:hypothetical protein
MARRARPGSVRTRRQGTRDADRAYWLARFTVEEIRELADAIWGDGVELSTHPSGPELISDDGTRLFKRAPQLQDAPLRKRWL